MIESEKYKIELDSLQASVRQICTKKYLGEFLKEDTYTRLVNQNKKQKSQSANIDLKSLEDQLNELIT